MQTDVQCEKISDYFSIHAVREFKVTVFDIFNINFAVENLQLPS